MRRALAGLTVVWLGSFAAALAVPATLYVRDTVGPDVALDAIRQTSAAFAPYLGVVLSYVFTRGEDAGRTRPGRLAVGVAYVTTLAWTLTAVGPLALTLGGDGFLEDAARQSREMSSYVSWLVAPALGYFFAADHQIVAAIKPAASA